MRRSICQSASKLCILWDLYILHFHFLDFIQLIVASYSKLISEKRRPVCGGCESIGSSQDVLRFLTKLGFRPNPTQLPSNTTLQQKLPRFLAELDRILPCPSLLRNLFQVPTQRWLRKRNYLGQNINMSEVFLFKGLVFRKKGWMTIIREGIKVEWGYCAAVRRIHWRHFLDVYRANLTLHTFIKPVSNHTTFCFKHFDLCIVLYLAFW